MIDWEQLERELADGAFEADGVGSAAARRRERRQLIVVAALAVVLLAALVVPLSVVVLRGRPGGGDTSASAPASPSAAHRAASAPTPGEGTPPQTVAAIYDAAIADGAPTPLTHRVWVRSTVCTAVPAPPDGRRCPGRPIPAAVQGRVRAALGPDVGFSRDPSVPFRAAGTVVVVLGRLVVDGDRARLGVDTLCGALCGHGGTVVLHRVDGTWRVTGTAGPRWVS